MLAVEYIQDRLNGGELKNWNVFVTSRGQKFEILTADNEDDPLSKVNARSRSKTVLKNNDRKESISFNQRNMLMGSDRLRDINPEDREKAEMNAPINKHEHYQYLKNLRTNPGLIICKMDLTIEPQNVKNNVIGWAISFPDTKLAERNMSYRCNATMQYQMGLTFDDQDEDEYEDEDGDGD
jgi:hypothetical protein